MKFYVSGPITGYPNKNKEAFAEASEKLRELGHTVLNPFELDLVEPCDPKDWNANMRRDLKYVPLADAFLMLPGWESSKGARLEVQIAYGLEIPCYGFDSRAELARVHIAVDVEIAPLIASDFLNLL